MKRKHYYGYASEIDKRFSSSEDGVECWTEDSVDVFRRAAISSYIRRPVEVVRVLEFERSC
jgi:hypothetical protein